MNKFATVLALSAANVNAWGGYYGDFAGYDMDPYAFGGFADDYNFAAPGVGPTFGVNRKGEIYDPWGGIDNPWGSWGGASRRQQVTKTNEIPEVKALDDLDDGEIDNDDVEETGGNEDNKYVVDYNSGRRSWGNFLNKTFGANGIRYN